MVEVDVVFVEELLKEKVVVTVFNEKFQDLGEEDLEKAAKLLAKGNVVVCRHDPVINCPAAPKDLNPLEEMEVFKKIGDVIWSRGIVANC